MRQAWATRIVYLMGGILVLASGYAAAFKSSLPPAVNAAAPVISAPKATATATAKPAAKLPANVVVAPTPTPAAAPAAAPGTPDAPLVGRLFADSFEKDAIGANPPAGWTVADGQWNGVVMDGNHVLLHGGGTSGHISAGDPNWVNYTVQADIKPIAAGGGYAGLMARFVDANNYYACGYSFSRALRLWRVKAGVMTVLDGRLEAVNAAQFHTVKLTVTGSSLVCTGDGLRLAFTDATIAKGKIGMVANTGIQAEFDQVAVN